MPASRLRQMHGLLATLAAAILLLLSLSFPSSAQAGDPAPLRGVALVIGQSKYAHLPQLPNAGNDADAIETLLADLGFDSVRRTDRDAPTLLRNLERFVEDAEGADVAVFYYSGHGIEAGGENWLVPVDADLSALDDAGASLVPVSATLEKLKATVPVAIVMLDACRDNPFPPGSLLRPAPGAEPVAVGAAGLGESGSGLSRSAVALTESPQEQASLPGINVGTVIAFAAEPGKVALDGDAGGNSPYASAVLRHFDAMTGEEFGLVMRMVAEEVYLRTGGRQYPWINENLRRLLYFGRIPAGPEGEEGEILRERRGLLVTISELPDASRRQVERIAASDGVPMDALYAMLKVLGQDAPSDTAQLEDILRRQTEHIRKLVAERATLDGLDPQIERLSALSRQAVDEGALDTAKRLRQQITERAAEVDSFLSDQESNILQRRIELASAHAESAEISAVAFDHLASASYWRLAYDQVSRSDRRLAWRYKHNEMLSLRDHFLYQGYRNVADRIFSAGKAALAIADSLDDRELWAETRLELGAAYALVGRHTKSLQQLQQALELYDEVLALTDRTQTPEKWAELQNVIGFSLRDMAVLEGSPERVEQSIAAFRRALEVRTREGSPEDWSDTQNNLGVALATLGNYTVEKRHFKSAIAAYRNSLAVVSRDETPQKWAATKHNIGMSLFSLGEQTNDLQAFRESVLSLQEALAAYSSEKMPVQWAKSQQVLGMTLGAIGQRSKGTEVLEDAAEAYRAALTVFTLERTPEDWASTHNSLGIVLETIGERNKDAESLRLAIANFRSALVVRTREAFPLDWANTQHNLGISLQKLGELEADDQYLEDAVETFRAAIETYELSERQLQRARVHFSLGVVLRKLSDRSDDDILILAQAIESYRSALEVFSLEKRWVEVVPAQRNLAIALRKLGERKGDPDLFRQSADAYRAGLEASRRTVAADEWQALNNGLGLALQDLGEAEDDTKVLEQSADAFRAALEDGAGGRDTAQDAMAWTNLGKVLMDIGMRKSSRNELEESREAFLSARRIQREENGSRYENYYTERVAEIDTLLSDME